MTRYTLHIPAANVDQYIPTILATFEGCTTVPGSVGYWRDPDTGVVYRDAMTLVHVDTDSTSARPQLESLARQIAHETGETCVYLTVQAIVAELVYPAETAAA